MNITFIEASAGTGKTYRLMELIAQRLGGANPKFDPSQLLVTTFTVKAAGELRERTQQKLLEDGSYSAAAQLRAALIGTVNSVAGQIVKDNAINLGLSPDLRVADENEAEVLLGRALGEATNHMMTPEVRGLLHRTGYKSDATSTPTGHSLRNAPDWRQEVHRVVAAARANNLTADYLRENATEESWKVLEEALPQRATVDTRKDWADQIAAATANLPDLKGPGRAAQAEEDEARAQEFAKKGKADPDAITWSEWLRCRFTDPPYRVKARRALAETRKAIFDALPANPRFQQDLRDLVELILNAAADTLAKYKELKDQAQVIDFIDQESLALNLLAWNPGARAQFQERYRLLAVDEFQDTSPIQLALFMQMSQLVDEVIWVGDQKQSIYAFRGADPRLMGAVRKGLRAEDPEVLSSTWRSNQPVIDLSNNLFTRIFPDLPSAAVRITIPSERQDDAGSHLKGAVEFWNVRPPTGRSTLDMEAAAIAVGVRDLKERLGCQWQDIAVLVRTNRTADRLSKALTNQGVPASPSHTISQTVEGRMVRDALALVANLHDRLPLVELVQLMDEHPAHKTWFADLAAASAKDRGTVSELFREWWDADCFARLRAVRFAAPQLGAVQLTESVIAALDMPTRVRAWENHDSRLATLDAILRRAGEYQQTATLPNAAGLVEVLDKDQEKVGAAATADSVFVGTVHQAKGLEWKAVAVELADRPVWTDLSGTFVYTQGDVDIEDPLAARQLRWLPQLPSLSKAEAADEPNALSQAKDRLERVPFIADQARLNREEESRLLYVALTRAKEVTALFASGAKVDPVGEQRPEGDRLLVPHKEKGVVDVSQAEADSEQRGVESGEARMLFSTRRAESDDDREAQADAEPAFELAARWYGYATAEPDFESTSEKVWVRDPNLMPLRRRPASRVRASGAASTELKASIDLLADLGPRLDTKSADWRLVGEAVHSFLAAGLSTVDEATEVLDAWFGTGDSPIAPEEVAAAGRRWRLWVQDTYPAATVETEVPFHWTNQKRQRMEGWVDTLITTEQGDLVVVDHKSYPGSRPAEHIRQTFLGQLNAYQQALAAAEGKKPALLVHFPLLGKIYSVRLQEAL